jgi:cytochrome subunit of sulfide dehydrogenase
VNRSIWLLGLLSSLVLMTFQAQAAKLSPTSLRLMTGETAKVSLSSISGTVSLTNPSPGIVSAQLSGKTLSVKALTPGSAVLSVKDNRGTVSLQANVQPAMTVSPETLILGVGALATITISNPSGSVTVANSNTRIASATLKGATITVTGKAAWKATLTIKDRKTTRTVAVQVNATVGGTTEGRLLASNCFQCHGTNGSGGFERLSGESAAELYSELTEYLSGGEDPDGIMAAHVAGYTTAQLRVIANYLANP